jgi:hypothetical protein
MLLTTQPPVYLMPPSASMNAGKFSKLTSTMWLTGIPRYCETVLVASPGPP